MDVEARWMRRTARIAGVVGVLVAVLVVRVVLASADELSRARELEEAGKLDAAVVHYRRAARWYAPGSPYPVQALAALADIARAAERGEERQHALTAWRAVRGAIMSTRSFYVPHEERLAEANRHIANLMASGNVPPIDAGKSRAQLRREHLALLERPTRPSIPWTLVLLLGFGTWVGGAFAFASRAIDDEDRLIPKAALRWGLVIVAGFASFVLGMWLA